MNKNNERFGIIPDNWSIQSIKDIYELRNEKVSDYDFPPLSVTKKGVVPQLETAAKSDAHDDRKLVRKGDFVINSRSDRRGSCGISDLDGSVSLINIIMKPREKINPRYYNFLFHSTCFSDEFYKRGHGIVDDLWTTKWEDMKKIKIPCPSMDEQLKIADFLEEKTRKINDTILLKERQIELLKEKKKVIIKDAVYKGIDNNNELIDSNISRIGKIPSNWKILRVKNGFSQKKSKAHIENPVILTLARSGVKIRDISSNDGQIAESYYDYNPVELNDLLLNPMDLISGDNCSLSQVEGVISPAYINLRYKEGYSPQYYNYFFKLQYRSMAFFAHGKGVSTENRWTLNVDTLMRYPIIVPPYNEQNKIAEFLNKNIGEIDLTISKIEKSIELMKEYKYALINYIVTGKVKVF